MESKLKCAKARNDYLLSLHAANAAISNYYVRDVADLLDVSPSSTQAGARTIKFGITKISAMHLVGLFLCCDKFLLSPSLRGCPHNNCILVLYQLSWSNHGNCSLVRTLRVLLALPSYCHGTTVPRIPGRVEGERSMTVKLLQEAPVSLPCLPFGYLAGVLEKAVSLAGDMLP